MSEKLKLAVDKRTVFGRKIKVLRRDGIIPANLFGKKVKSLGIQLKQLTFEKIYKEAGETALINLTIEGETKVRPVLISSLTRHPVTGVIIHVDFHQVDLAEKVTATIPLKFEGESPAIKELGGIMVQVMSEIEVEALPADFPEYIGVDISSMVKIGDAITVKDLVFDRKKVTALTEEIETVVTIQAPKEEVVEETVETPAEAETIVQAKPEESPTPEPEKK